MEFFIRIFCFMLYSLFAFQRMSRGQSFFLKCRYFSQKPRYEPLFSHDVRTDKLWFFSTYTPLFWMNFDPGCLLESWFNFNFILCNLWPFLEKTESSSINLIEVQDQFRKPIICCHWKDPERPGEFMAIGLVKKIIFHTSGRPWIGTSTKWNSRWVYEVRIISYYVVLHTPLSHFPLITWGQLLYSLCLISLQFQREYFRHSPRPLLGYPASLYILWTSSRPICISINQNILDCVWVLGCTPCQPTSQ